MIIVWKWLKFHTNRVNDAYLDKQENKKYLKSVIKGRGKYFEEYPVVKSSGTRDGKVIIANIYKGQKTRKILRNLIEYYTEEDSKIMLFLHRANFYDQEDMAQILKDHPQIWKGFLFGYNRDFIYYDTGNQGLLDDTGYFMIDKDRKIKTFDQSTQMVLQPHFDRVWSHYEHEIENKIFELEQDFFAVVSRFLLPGTPESIDQCELIATLKESSTQLYLRLKSFLGFYDDLDGEEEEVEEVFDFDFDPGPEDLLKDEKEQLEKFEVDSQASYTFDDVRANLEKEDSEKNKQIASIYDQLEEEMRRAIIPPDDDSLVMIQKQILRDIRDHFATLLKAIRDTSL